MAPAFPIGWSPAFPIRHGPACRGHLTNNRAAAGGPDKRGHDVGVADVAQRARRTWRGDRGTTGVADVARRTWRVRHGGRNAAGYQSGTNADFPRFRNEPTPFLA